MTAYLLLFRNASSDYGYLTASQDISEVMPKWQSWIGNFALQGKLVHDNLEEGQEWSKTCPILKYPNSSVEIRPLIPFSTN